MSGNPGGAIWLSVYERIRSVTDRYGGMLYSKMLNYSDLCCLCFLA